MAGPPFDRLKPGQRQVPASLINDALTEIERLGMFDRGEGGEAALQAIGGLPPRILARITATDGGTPPKYSWDLLRNDGTGYFTADPMAGGGVPTFYPLVEISGNAAVPVDGSAVVEAWPAVGAEQFEFFYPPGAAGGGGGAPVFRGARISGSATVPTGVSTTLALASTLYDTGGHVGTTVGQLTISETGFYHIGCSMEWDIQSSGWRQCGIFSGLSGTPIIADSRNSGFSGLLRHGAGVPFYASLTPPATTEFHVNVFQTSGLDLAVNGTFWLHRLAGVDGGGGGGGGGFTGTIGGP